MPYNHMEAFCLMQYENEVTHEVEWIWNSRDGVTPFGIRSRDGKHNMLHVRWPEDRRSELHVPAVGDRIFVTMTRERALAIAQDRVEHYWEHPEYPLKDRYPSREHAVRCFAVDALSTFENPPEVEVVDEFTHEVFKARADRLSLCKNPPEKFA